MKKCILVMLCLMSAVHAGKEPVIVDVHYGDVDLCHVELKPGATLEIDRLLGDDSTVAVRSGNMTSRIGTSLFRTMADSPFLTAIAMWALIFSRESIGDHPIKSMIIGGVLISDFALHMLHSAEQTIHIES